MNNVQMPAVRSGGVELETDESALGWLEPSNHLLDDPDALRQQLAQDGYLFLRGLLEREAVMQARREICRRLAEEGALDPAKPVEEAYFRPNSNLTFRPDLAKDNQPLQQLLYSGAIMELMGRLLPGPVRHFDYTWLRAVARGHGTPSHCDVVYMGRGTPDLYTLWTPLGDVDFDLGGLMVLEGSHLNKRMRETYCTLDVDAHCVNRDGPASKDAWAKGNGGFLAKNARQVRRSVGGRWLIGQYQAGDILIFNIFLLHASLDNHTDRIRLSSDSRYQRADQPADERWIGPNPPAHGPAAKRGLIC